MRQLDLFGSFIDTSSESKKAEENESVLKKEEIPAMSNTEEISYSLVELAEEMLGADTDNDSQEKIEIADNIQFAEPTGNEFLNANEITEDFTEEINIEQIETSGVFLIENEIFEEKDAVSKQNESSEPEIGIKERSRKEPQKRGRKSLQEIEAEVDLIEVPEDEILFQKQYYSISEVANWFRVNTSLLRFWENEFDILKPRKNRKGDRLFRPEDVKNLQLIYQLLRQRKYTIEGAKEYIKTHKRKADVQLQLTTTLQKFKSFLLDLKANLQ